MSNPIRKAAKTAAKASRAPAELGTARSAPPAFGARSIGVRSHAEKKVVVPLRDRCWDSIDEASQVAGARPSFSLILLSSLGRRTR
jgi:hypothetical protein